MEKRLAGATDAACAENSRVAVIHAAVRRVFVQLHKCMVDTESNSSMSCLFSQLLQVGIGSRCTQREL
jgi:hypothetical protein